MRQCSWARTDVIDGIQRDGRHHSFERAHHAVCPANGVWVEAWVPLHHLLQRQLRLLRPRLWQAKVIDDRVVLDVPIRANDLHATR